MNSRKALVVICVMISMSTHASEKCAQVADDRLRLECYDLEYRKTAEITTESEWSVREEVSRVDDSRNVFLTVSSKEAVRSPFGRPASAELHIQCRENTTLLFVVLGGNFLSDIQGYGEVTYRIDTKPASRINMTVSTDNKALGLWSGGKSIPFIRSLFESSNLLIRITPYNQSAITVDFPTQGIEEAVKPLRSACKW